MMVFGINNMPFFCDKTKFEKFLKTEDGIMTEDGNKFFSNFVEIIKRNAGCLTPMYDPALTLFSCLGISGKFLTPELFQTSLLLSLVCCNTNDTFEETFEKCIKTANVTQEQKQQIINHTFFYAMTVTTMVGNNTN